MKPTVSSLAKARCGVSPVAKASAEPPAPSNNWRRSVTRAAGLKREDDAREGKERDIGSSCRRRDRSGFASLRPDAQLAPRIIAAVNLGGAAEETCRRRACFVGSAPLRGLICGEGTHRRTPERAIRRLRGRAPRPARRRSGQE